jgi:hypothetical protein
LDIVFHNKKSKSFYYVFCFFTLSVNPSNLLNNIVIFYGRGPPSAGPQPCLNQKPEVLIGPALRPSRNEGPSIPDLFNRSGKGLEKADASSAYPTEGWKQRKLTLLEKLAFIY